MSSDHYGRAGGVLKLAAQARLDAAQSAIVGALRNQHLEAFDEDAYRHGRAQASCKAFI
ncbi:hypothetical protein D3C87_1688330 [compost metagenome]